MVFETTAYAIPPLRLSANIIRQKRAAVQRGRDASTTHAQAAPDLRHGGTEKCREGKCEVGRGYVDLLLFHL